MQNIIENEIDQICGGLILYYPQEVNTEAPN